MNIDFDKADELYDKYKNDFPEELEKLRQTPFDVSFKQAQKQYEDSLMKGY